MSQKLSNLANVAEVLSGIAVVITLVILILGIRENTEVTRASMFQNTTGRLIEWRDRSIDDPEIAVLLRSVFDSNYDGISEVDSFRQSQLMLSLFQIYEQAYFANKSGFLGEQEWSRFERPICQFYSLSAGSPWGLAVLGSMTEEFAGYVEVSCAN
jgi:hypothetical protein